MSSPFYQRKWAGTPHTEAKRIPPEPPNKLGPRKKKGKKEAEFNSDVWGLLPSKYGGWWWSDNKNHEKPYLPCVGRHFTPWYVWRAIEHVVRRSKAVIRKNRAMGVYWLEEVGTKKQLSPEFSEFDCFMNWMFYKGFSRGWLYISNFTDYHGKKRYRVEHQ